MECTSVNDRVPEGMAVTALFVCGNCPAGHSGDGVECHDTNGCDDHPCYDSVPCTDVLAPDDGFICDPCPPGHAGDGVTCAYIPLPEPEPEPEPVPEPEEAPSGDAPLLLFRQTFGTNRQATEYMYNQTR